MVPTFSTLVNEFFNDADTNRLLKPQRTRLHANVIKNDNAYIVELAVPGYKKENIDIQLEEGKLTVTAGATESKEETSTYQLREFSFTQSSRTFTLPKDVHADEISAKHQDGVLSINLPIAPEAKPRQIDITID